LSGISLNQQLFSTFYESQMLWLRANQPGRKRIYLERITHNDLAIL